MKNPLSHESPDRSVELQCISDYMLAINLSFEGLHFTAWNTDASIVESELALQSAHQVRQQRLATVEQPAPAQQLAQIEQPTQPVQPVYQPAVVVAEAPANKDELDQIENVARLRLIVSQTSATADETRRATSVTDGNPYPISFLNDRAA